MPVSDADPAARSLDAAFAEAMGAPARPKEPAPPPEIDPEAPHGRDEAGEPLEPFGRNKDGSVRRSAAGRKSRDDKARTGPPATEVVITGKVVLEPKDYSEALAEAADAGWFALSGLGMVGGKLPVIGRLVPEQVLAAEAAVFRGQKEPLVNAVNLAAQHNKRARRFAEACAAGTVSWVLMAGFLAMPFLVQTAAVIQGDKALAAREMPTRAALAQANKADIEQFMKDMAGQLEALAGLAAQEEAA